MTAHLRGDERVLVWLPGWLGDCVMAEPVVAALAAFVGQGGGRLTVVAPLPFWAVLGGPEAGGDEPTAADWVDARDVRATDAALGQAEVALLLRGSFRSAWRAFRARVPRRIGFSRDLRAALLTDGVVPARRRFGGKDALAVRPFGDDVGELANLVGVPLRRARPVVLVRPAWDRRVAKRLAEWGDAPASARGFVLVNVGGREASAKAFPAWAPVLAELLGAGERVVLVTGPGEEANLDEVLAALPVAPPADQLLAWRAPVADLGEMAALGQRARTCLTTDGGARHVLAAAGARLVVLFGPTSPHHTAAHLERTTSLVGQAPCAPCHLERCDQPDVQRCFHALAPGEIAAAALS